MKLTFKKVTIFSPDIMRVKQLYETSFPPEEKFPFLLMLLKAGGKNAECRSVWHGDEFVGMFYFIMEEDLVYLFYLAVDDSHRGKGYGSCIIKSFKKRFAGKRFFLALEQLDPKADNYSQRVSRHIFYEKNGLRDMHCKLREQNVYFDSMGFGGCISPVEHIRMIKNYLGGFLSAIYNVDSWI